MTNLYLPASQIVDFINVRANTAPDKIFFNHSIEL